jgi:hypothetical protein
MTWSLSASGSKEDVIRSLESQQGASDPTEEEKETIVIVRSGLIALTRMTPESTAEIEHTVAAAAHGHGSTLAAFSIAPSSRAI